MSGVRSINQPSVNATGQPTLSVDKWGSPYGNPVVIDTSGTTMRIKDGAHAVSVLNNTNITVVLLTFDHLYAGGTSPESVTAHLTLSTRTSAGLLIQETFSTTSYVRK
jgi:hypothetical protein